MKIALAQINTIPCDLKGNFEKVMQACLKAHEGGASLVIFSNGAMSGIPLYNMAQNEHFVEQHAKQLKLLATKTKSIIELVIRGPEAIETGKTVHLKDGKIKYCEGDSIVHQSQKMFVYPSANVFTYSISASMSEILIDQAKLSEHPIIYVNQVGASTETLWGGGSMAIWNQGKHMVRLPLFEETIEIIDLQKKPKNQGAKWGDKITQTHQALVMGIKDFFEKNNFSHACVAFSGGIDSAVVLALAVEALGSERVRAIMLPSAYSSDHSLGDSIEMAKRCGIQLDKVPIEPILKEAEKAMTPILEGPPSGLAHENMQSRIRLMLTMVLSNQTGALMLNTSNKSEIAVGYGTLYGDTSGALAAIADLYKNEVYDLAKHINSTYKNIIPQNIITKAPSAELRPDQKDSDSLPPYPTLDKVLHMLIEEQMTTEQIMKSKRLTPEQKIDVPRIANLLWISDFKRHQLPPPLRVSGSTFNYEYLMPITKRRW